MFFIVRSFVVLKAKDNATQNDSFFQTALDYGLLGGGCAIPQFPAARIEFVNNYNYVSLWKIKIHPYTHYTKQCTQVIITYQLCCEQKSFHILGYYGNFDNFIVFFWKNYKKENWWFGNKKIGLPILQEAHLFLEQKKH